MDKPNVPALLMLTLGVYLIWCGLTGRNPVATAKAILQGKPIPARKTMSGNAPGSSSGSNGSVIPSIPNPFSNINPGDLGTGKTI